ncbi:unnamed protein product [Schistocephalus solidus]|uniref:C2 NT-type domain-containing protein n=1 Tax=Schistocephalus solidus TaxID=70667 RepID=A0A183SFN7_SCHSO|nr:unnamed protein product [Schistocephalus solidus]
MTHHSSVVWLAYPAHEELCSFELEEDPPEYVVIQGIAGLRQVPKAGTGTCLHFLEFLFLLARDEDQVNSSMVSAETESTFWEETVFQVAVETIEGDAGGNSVNITAEVIRGLPLPSDLLEKLFAPSQSSTRSNSSTGSRNINRGYRERGEIISSTSAIPDTSSIRSISSNDMINLSTADAANDDYEEK